MLGGLASERSQALAALDRAWASGEVAERFARMVSALGGPQDLLERYAQQLPKAPVIRPLFAAQAGPIQAMDLRAIGLAVVALGGGRRRASDPIDPAVGLSDLATVGDPVDANRPLAVIHARSSADAEQAALALQAAVTIGQEPVAETPLIARRINPTA
ncbi:MAG: hypothetical protein ACXIUM_05525 [Wenzhouxiangella sp.]